MEHTTDKITSTDITRALAVKHHKDFFLTEVKSGSTWMTPSGEMKRLDGLAIKKSWTRTCFTGYEVKISRGDFLRDAKFYTYEELCNELYIVCPKGLIKREELPESVGLMYYDSGSKTIQTKKKAIFRKIEYSADMLLYIIFSRLDSDRFPFYTTREQYCTDYINHEIDNRTLAERVKSRLIEDNARMEKELEYAKNETITKKLKRLSLIESLLEQHGIWCFESDDKYLEHLNEKLSGHILPRQIKIARKDIEMALESIKSLEGIVSNEPQS